MTGAATDLAVVLLFSHDLCKNELVTEFTSSFHFNFAISRSRDSANRTPQGYCLFDCWLTVTYFINGKRTEIPENEIPDLGREGRGPLNLSCELPYLLKFPQQVKANWLGESFLLTFLVIYVV